MASNLIRADNAIDEIAQRLCSCFSMVISMVLSWYSRGTFGTFGALACVLSYLARSRACRNSLTKSVLETRSNWWAAMAGCRHFSGSKQRDHFGWWLSRSSLHRGTRISCVWHIVFALLRARGRMISLPALSSTLSSNVRERQYERQYERQQIASRSPTGTKQRERRTK